MVVRSATKLQFRPDVFSYDIGRVMHETCQAKTGTSRSVDRFLSQLAWLERTEGVLGPDRTGVAIESLERV